MPARRADIDDQRIIDLYEQGQSSREIAKLFGVCDNTVIYRLRKLGVPRRRSGPQRKFDDAEVCRLYRAGASIAEIVEKTGVTNTAVFYDILKRNGVPTRLKRHKLDCPDVQREILALYEQGLTRLSISKKMGINRTYVGEFLRAYPKSAKVSVLARPIAYAPLFSSRFMHLLKRVDNLLMSSDDSDAVIAAKCGCLVEFVRRQRRFVSALS